MLRENLSIGRKILSCNLIPTNVFDFPLNGICSINRCSYYEFEERLLKILNMSNYDFLNSIKHNGFDLNYLMEFDKNYSSLDKIKCKLKSYLDI
jgi:hypothetical protein